jgi:hypothetical protein
MDHKKYGLWVPTAFLFLESPLSRGDAGWADFPVFDIRFAVDHFSVILSVLGVDPYSILSHLRLLVLLRLPSFSFPAF